MNFEIGYRSEKNTNDEVTFNGFIRRNLVNTNHSGSTHIKKLFLSMILLQILEKFLI
jgi:hypothetical protein